MPAKLAPAPAPPKVKKTAAKAAIIEPREKLVLDAVAGSKSDIELARLVHTLFPDRVRFMNGLWYEKGATEPAYDDIPLRHLLIDAQTFIEQTLAKHRVPAAKAPEVVPGSFRMRESRIVWALEVLYYLKPEEEGEGTHPDETQDDS